MEKLDGFPKRLKKIRKDSNLGQKEFGKIIGPHNKPLSQSAITNLETVGPAQSLEKYVKLATDFGVNLHWLFTGEGQPYKNDNLRTDEMFKRMKQIERERDLLITENLELREKIKKQENDFSYVKKEIELIKDKIRSLELS